MPPPSACNPTKAKKSRSRTSLASEVLERDFFAFVGLQAEGGGIGAYFEHGKFLTSVVGSITGIGANGLGRSPYRRSSSATKKNSDKFHFAYASNLRRMSLTACGLAWPRVAFMT